MPRKNTTDTPAMSGTDPIAVGAPGTRRTKGAILREMLERPEGAHLAALCAATIWQAHSVRAALSGLRKTGVIVERQAAEGPGGPLYRIVAGVRTAEDMPTGPVRERGTVE